MNELLFFVLGLTMGILLGVNMMFLLQIKLNNKDTKIEKTINR